MRQLWCVRADLFFSCHAIWVEGSCREIRRCGLLRRFVWMGREGWVWRPGTAACMRVAHLLDVLSRRIEISPL